MDDRLVSLDAAIKEVESLVDTMSVCINMDECRGMRSMKRRVLDRLESLPSTQPEPTTEIQEILNYLDTTLHPIVSPDNWNVYSELHDMVSKLPSAQPERKKGHWIDVNDNYNRIRGRCSECGWESHMYEDDVVGMDYCPNCGADMRKDGARHD